MKKIDIAKLNRANTDIWQMILKGLKTKNLAVIEQNLKRLHSLQKYYTDLLNFNEFEIEALKNDLEAERYLSSTFEKEWIESVSKKSGTYEIMKSRIEETFKEL
jgi:hypothetical protein